MSVQKYDLLVKEQKLECNVWLTGKRFKFFKDKKQLCPDRFGRFPAPLNEKERPFRLKIMSDSELLQGEIQKF